MLVISRRNGETVKIGDTVIKVVSKHGPVKLVIEAPSDVRILRGELVEKKAA